MDRRTASESGNKLGINKTISSKSEFEMFFVDGFDLVYKSVYRELTMLWRTCASMSPSGVPV